MLAAFKGETNIVEVLLDRGADINQKENVPFSSHEFINLKNFLFKYKFCFE